MKYNPVSRRMFLQGLGGYALAIPFLPSLASKAHAADAVPPLRFSMMFARFGRDMSQWYPNLPDSAMQNVGGAFVKSLADIPKPISYSLGAGFNPVLSKIALIRGLDSVSTNGMHNRSVPTTGSAFDPSAANGFGYSIDAVLEESRKFYPNLPRIGALRTCPHTTQPFHDFVSFSYTSKVSLGQMINYAWNPQQVYSSLLDPQNHALIDQRNGKIRSVTDVVLDSYQKTINSKAISAQDKQRLENYMNLQSEVHAAMAVQSPQCGIAGAPVDSKVYSEIHKAMIKLEVAALACGTTKIVMHSLGHNGDVESPQWHDHAHGGEYTINPASGRSFHSEYAKYTMDLVAYYLTALDSIQDSNGTLLDNTLFIYSNEDGTGSHEHFDLPVVVAGAKGKLKTGYFIDYRPRPFVPLINPREKQMLYAGRPYNSLLVTAFKALGLGPADYQKFGMQGFGRYDRFPDRAKEAYRPFLGSAVNDPLPFLYAA